MDLRATMSVVFTQLNGGLGNQMFQYAAARALALRKGAEVVLDLTNYDVLNTSRPYQLHVYPLGARTTTVAERIVLRIAKKHAARFSRIRYKLPVVPRIYDERHFHFDEAIGEQTPPVLLRGYWQSERYFADAADVVRREFTPSAPRDALNAEMAHRIMAVEAVSLHVRRGDYVSNAGTNAFHGVCPLGYYRDAVALLRGRIADPHLFVFSDEPDWVRANLKFDLPLTYVSINPGDRAFRDIQLMRLCQHHIVANSSFSWWGAWLNPSPRKIVIGPKRWIADLRLRTVDLMPPSWLKL
jgi:Glycosyl transferase family 11